jgi:hypothetical protein
MHLLVLSLNLPDEAIYSEDRLRFVKYPCFYMWYLSSIERVQMLDNVVFFIQISFDALWRSYSSFFFYFYNSYNLEVITFLIMF